MGIGIPEPPLVLPIPSSCMGRLKIGGLAHRKWNTPPRRPVRRLKRDYRWGRRCYRGDGCGREGIRLSDIRLGRMPNCRLNSRLNWDALLYPTSYAASLAL